MGVCKFADNKADARGFFAKLSESMKIRRGPRTEEDDEMASLADSFIGDEQLEDFDPRGRAGMEVLGPTADGAIDMDFTWDEGDVDDVSGKAQDSKASSKAPRGMPSTELDPRTIPRPQEAARLQRLGGRVAAPAGSGKVAAEQYVRPAVPKLTIVMLICGTRGDVQPFIALGLKLKDYGHRIRVATHKDYRKFVTGYGLEFYPLGGDPKILSDFIVKHRGVFTTNTKDAFENIKQVHDIVFSSYDACTQPDPEGDQTPFQAQAIIANPPSYGHIHCAEKLKVPLHIYFTMPWTPTRHFPHPLARIKNVRDTRPSSIAIRNYLSYIIVNEYTYTGLSSIFNSFRKEVLDLPPIRMGNSGATLLDAHNVPFSYCWSPSLVAKPSDWDEHIDVTGYFFLNEGVRGSYQPPQQLADFLAAGPAPVYIGFGSLIVDDREKVTHKILDAVKETSLRLLLSKGWAGLGEGFELPDSVMLLDDVPHDWLLPQCSAVVHHGGAGTTAAGLIAACPTTVIPFFGDQAFWGSAVYRRGVGPRPIPIDSLTTKKLVEALQYMQKPEVKVEAIRVSEQIKAEDGVGMGMDAFHRHLPVEELIAGAPSDWNLAKPSVAGFFSELGGGIADLFIDPVKGAKEEGVKGAFKGMGRGMSHAVTRPIKGFGLASYSIWESVNDSSVLAKRSNSTKGEVQSIRSDSGTSEKSLGTLKEGGPHRSLGSFFKRHSMQKRGEPAAAAPDPGAYGEQLPVASDPPEGSAQLEEEEAAEQPEEAAEQPQELPSQYKRTFSFRMIPEVPPSEAAASGEEPMATMSHTDAAPQAIS